VAAADNQYIADRISPTANASVEACIRQKIERQILQVKADNFYQPHLQSFILPLPL
jgi:hypothetical protein